MKEEDGKMTGIVKSVLFKGVHYEIMVETVPGTTVSVMMNVTEEHDVSSSDAKERISANDFYVDIEDVKELNDAEIIARADAQAWSPQDDEYISSIKLNMIYRRRSVRIRLPSPQAPERVFHQGVCGAAEIRGESKGERSDFRLQFL